VEALGPPEPLSSAHDASAFACGVPALDAWLRRCPPSGAFVVHETGRVRGLYTLAPGSVRARGDRPARSLPILKLGRLAVNRPAQGQGLGTALVLDAFARTYIVSRRTPVAALVADPPPAAREWLRGLGFLPLPGDASAMFVALATIEALVEGG
jgi:GNAT superfamily N-acetyltransferase